MFSRISRDDTSVDPSGIINTGESADPPALVAAIAVGTQYHTFNVPIKKLILDFHQETAVAADLGLKIYVAFGATDLADAKVRLADPALRQVVSLGEVASFPFPDAGGLPNFAYCASILADETKVTWEVTL